MKLKPNTLERAWAACGFVFTRANDFFPQRIHFLIRIIINVENGIHLQGNKGAVSIRFNLYGVSVCLVNSHLAAHDHMLDERIKDFEKIVDEHKFHIRQTQDIFQHE